jgi:hypothetical protein
MYMNTFVYMNMLIAKKEGKGTPAPKGGTFDASAGVHGIADIRAEW